MTCVWYKSLPDTETLPTRKVTGKPDWKNSKLSLLNYILCNRKSIFTKNPYLSNRALKSKKMESIAARKYALMEKIMHLSEEELTELEVSLMKFSEEDVSIEQYNKELDEADAAIDRGEYITHE